VSIGFACAAPDADDAPDLMPTYIEPVVEDTWTTLLALADPSALASTSAMGVSSAPCASHVPA